MGIYYLLKNLLIHGRPVWQHKNGKYFLRMDSEGSWIISKVHNMYTVGEFKDLTNYPKLQTSMGVRPKSYLQNLKIIKKLNSYIFQNCFQSQLETSQIAYFGTNIYKGVILPNIIRNMTWVHYGDDENDLDQDYQYIEDSEVLVQDICGSESVTACGINEQLDDGMNCTQ